MYSRTLVSKNLSDLFSIKNDLKQGDVLSPLFLNFTFVHAIRRVQVILEGLKINAKDQFLVYANDVNIYWEEVTYCKEKHRSLKCLVEIGLEVKADKSIHGHISRDRNVGQSHNMKIDNSPFEKVEDVKYL
jgi:predicted SPOUT superfamily RNA methylase MTH1